jgi:hypothetical protein
VKSVPTIAVGNPVLLPRVGLSIKGQVMPRQYDMLPDDRMLGIIPPGQTASGASAPQEIRVVLNWFEELKARVPAK